MAYVDIPKDLSEIRSKFILGLTRKQIIGFGVAAVIGVPVFLTTRAAVGNDLGLLMMIGSMGLPLLYAIYEPKGMTVEQMAVAWLRFHFISVGPRPYQNVTLYEWIVDSGQLKVKESASRTISKSSRSDTKTIHSPLSTLNSKMRGEESHAKTKKALPKKTSRTDRRAASAGRGDRKKPPRKQGK